MTTKNAKSNFFGFDSRNRASDTISNLHEEPDSGGALDRGPPRNQALAGPGGGAPGTGVGQAQAIASD